MYDLKGSKKLKSSTEDRPIFEDLPRPEAEAKTKDLTLRGQDQGQGLQKLSSRPRTISRPPPLLMINYPSYSSDSEQKKKIDDLVKEQHINKGYFDTKVSEYVKAADLSLKEVAKVFSVPRTLRSYTSGRSRRSSSHHSSSSSSTSNSLKARLLVEEEAARLKLEHVKERQCLEHEARENLKRYEEEEAERNRIWEEEEEMERKREEAKKPKWQKEAGESKRKLQEEADEIKKNIELLQAKHQLEEARLERQVIREELDH